MKKYLLLLIALLPLCGCEPEDFIGDPDTANTRAMFESNNPNRFFSFPSLTGGEGLGVHLIDPLDYKTYEEYHQQPGVSDRRLVVAIHNYDPQVYMHWFDGAHARALDRIAEQYKDQLEFAIIFVQTDVCSLDDVSTPENRMSWVRELKNIKLYGSLSCEPDNTDPNKKHYYQTSGVIAGAMQRRKPYTTPLHFPHTFFIAHDKVYDYSEPRISEFEIYTPEEIVPGPEVLEEDFYKTISKNIKQFIEDADNEI